MNSKVLLALVTVFCFIELCYSIRCYKCRGGDECDFDKRSIYVDNCTWATKCWGARIGGSFIRGCADDRCNIQLGVGAYVETKCCYKDLCNDERFFMPDSSQMLQSLNFKTLISIAVLSCFVTLFYN